MSLPIYNCIINEDLNDDTGVYAISFVDCPANEVDFITLSKDKTIFLNKDDKKQILTGVVLKPDQLIYRNSEQSGEHYIKFSSEQIEKIAHKMMRTGVSLYNTTHQHQTPLNGNYLTELWIVEDSQNDKSNALGFENLPKGTLMCSYKVDDRVYWDSQVMSGNVKGFSLEGFFNQEISMSKISIKSNIKKQIMNKKRKKRTLLGKIGRFLLDIENVESEDTTESGEAFVIFVLADGKEVYVDADGFATMDEEQMPAGEHNLADGNILVIDEQGQFVETREASTTNTDPEEATAPQTLKKTNKPAKKAVKLEETTVETETIESLKATIAEMQAKIDELVGTVSEATETVEELKKKTPSAQPAVQKQTDKKMTEMSAHERVAHIASLRVKK